MQEKNIIYENEEIVVVLSENPISKGHVIIQTKEMFSDLDELPEPLLKKVINLAQSFVRILKKKYSPKGYSIMQNGGDFNDIGVFHLHVFPRNKEKEFEYKKANNSEQADVQELQKLLGTEMKKNSKG